MLYISTKFCLRTTFGVKVTAAHLLFVPKMKRCMRAVTNFTIRVNTRPHFSIVLTPSGMCSPKLLLLCRYEMVAINVNEYGIV